MCFLRMIQFTGKYSPCTVVFYFYFQAVNKLAEIMNRKEFRNQSKNKNNNSDQSIKKKDRELRKLQQELLMVR